MAKKKKAKYQDIWTFDYTTVEPSGVTITRNGLKFVVKWKKGDKNYDAGQEVQWSINRSNKWTSVPDVQTSDTSKEITLTASNYFPTTSTKITDIGFRVRGKRSKSSLESKSEKVGNLYWSSWEEGHFAITAPVKATASSAWGGSSNPYTSTFTFGATSKTNDAKQYASVKWETMLVKDCKETDGNKLTWKSTAAGYDSGVSTNTSGTVSKTENSQTIVGKNNTYTRWFRVQSRGLAGIGGGWAYAKHVYATPLDPVIKKTEYTTSESVPVLTVTWNADSNAAHPIDQTAVEWVVDTPAAGLTCPSGTSWTTASTPKDSKNDDKARFQVPTAVGLDKCLWTRVELTHDENKSYSAHTLCKKGKLTAPSGLSVDANSSTYKATVAATQNSSVPDAKLAVIFRQTKNPTQDLIVGIIESGSSSVTVQCPNWSTMGAIAFGVYAFQGTATAKTKPNNVNQYVVSRNMWSDTVWDGGAVPVAPSNVTANPSDTIGEIIVTWKWAWSSADVAEISWSQNPNAWESTDEPETYNVTNLSVAKWRISGLETGVQWYVRVRLGITSSEDDITWGPPCEAIPVDLSSAPAVPNLVLSESVITASGSVVASWVYVCDDGTAQNYAEICEATVSASSISYGTIIAHTETAQRIIINAKDAGWLTGTTHNLCVRVSSAAGRDSDGWSNPVPITIADPATCSIESTSLENVTVTDDTGSTRTVLSLTEMPLSVTTSGAGIAGTTTVVIERAQDYSIMRPDDTEFRGYEGETIALVMISGEGTVTISADDLIGMLDDEAKYRIVATVQDELGQTASASVDFEVHWSHQAVIPVATALVDENEYVAFITPTAPAGAASGDTCDIYRLSADKPELIVSGAVWGTTYVDPFPALGEFGGHRVVFRTVNGDYITADNTMAWIDLQEDDRDILNVESSIIDFPDGRAVLDHNLTLSHTWKKDFQETKYLGGAIQGDWNPGVSRTMKLTGVAVVEDDPEMIQTFRKLSAYAGICHVRTPEGSSFAADVQVQEDEGYSDGAQTASFSLTITRVDPEWLDGLPYSEWNPEE